MRGIIPPFETQILEGQLVQQPEDVITLLALAKLGWGSKRIAREMGISRNTVRHYLRQKGWASYGKPKRRKILDGLEDWLKQRCLLHKGNAEVVRQELIQDRGVKVCLRTVERALQSFRNEITAQAKATVRFETSPGRQLQIDFGETWVVIGGEKVKVHLFVSTLGYSRRQYVWPFRHEQQSAWMQGIEGAFQYFGGIPTELLLDNPRALVVAHQMGKKAVFNESFRAFAAYWGIHPVACAPYRARTKGKDERSVGYVKGNAIAGRSHASWSALEQHLLWWLREVADIRIHGTTGESPQDRFVIESPALQPLNGRPPFFQIRELKRVVHNDACVEVDTNNYSVPWRLIGRRVSVQLIDGYVKVLHAGEEVALHIECSGFKQRCIDPSHLAGIVGASRSEHVEKVVCLPQSDLLRPLTEYEAVVGGRWS